MIEYLKPLDAVKFYDMNMNEIDTGDLFFEEMNDPSVPFENNWTGEDGMVPVFMGAEIKQRPLEVKVSLFSRDVPDYYLLKRKMYRTFGIGSPFYVVPRYERGKRFKAILDENMSISERIDPMYGKATISFMTFETPYAESIGTTMDLHRDGIDAEKGLWGYGMGLIDDPAATQYIHTGTSFSIYNAGDTEIHPFEQELKITIDQVIGAKNPFTLENRTTGDVFMVNEALAGTLVLDDHEITINGAAALRKTNRQYITLAPGWNEFVITGATSARVSFDTRFYYQ